MICKQKLLVSITAGLLALLLGGCAMLPEQKAAQELMLAGNLRGALVQYEQALKKVQGKEQKEAISKQIAELRERLTREALQEAEEAARPGTIPALSKAVEIIKRELAYDDAAGRLEQARKEYLGMLRNRMERYEAALEQASKGEKEDAWTAAAVALQEAAKLNPSAELTQRLNRLVQRRDNYVPIFIEKLLDTKNLEAAEEQYRRFAAEVPEPSSSLLNALQKKVEELRKEILEARVKEMLAQKKYFTAYQLIKDSNREYLDYHLKTIREEGGRFYKARAAEEFSEGLSRLGYAFFAADKALQLLPDDLDAFRLRRDIADVLDAQITQQIAIDAFTAPAAEREAGVSLSNTLMAHLKRNLPYGIQILERRAIENALSEKGASRADLESKVKMWIMGDVTTLNVERKRSGGEGTAKVHKGTTSRANPDYIRLITQYGRDQKKWPMAYQGVSPEVQEPIIDLIKYNFGEEILNGLMVVSVRTFESAQGAIKDAQDFKSIVSTNDMFNDEVADAVPKILRNPLQLPTDNEVKELLRNDLAEQIGRYVLAAFEQREKRFLQSAVNSINRKEYSDAVRDLAGGYYYAHQDKRYIPNPEVDTTTIKLRQLGFFDYTE